MSWKEETPRGRRVRFSLRYCSAWRWVMWAISGNLSMNLAMRILRWAERYFMWQTLAMTSRLGMEWR